MIRRQSREENEGMGCFGIGLTVLLLVAAAVGAGMWLANYFLPK